MSCAIIRGRVAQNFFITVKIFFFSKLSSFNSLLDPKESSYKFQSKCQNTFRSLIICSLMFVTLDATRKNGTKFFIILKTANFWNGCFYRPLWSQRNDLIICTIFVKIHCGPWQFVAWHISCAIKLGEIGQNFFITGKIAFFSKFSFPNNLLGPEEMLLYVPE